MARAIVYLYATDPDDFINLEANEMRLTDDNIMITNDGNLVGVFATSEVRAAYISKKREEQKNV